MELIVGGVIACGISWSKLEKESGIYKGDQQKIHIFYGSSFLFLGFSSTIQHTFMEAPLL